MTDEINDSFDSQLSSFQPWDFGPIEWPEIPIWKMKVIEYDDSTLEMGSFKVVYGQNDSLLFSISYPNRRDALNVASGYAKGWCSGQGAMAEIDYELQHWDGIDR